MQAVRAYFRKERNSQSDEGGCGGKKILRVADSISISLSSLGETISFLESPYFRCCQENLACITVSRESLETSIFHPCKLGQMYWFFKLVDEEMRDGRGLVVCAGQDSEMITECALLVRAYMILREGTNREELCSIFQPISHHLVGFQDEHSVYTDKLTVFDFFSAVFIAKSLGWIDFTSKQPDIDRSIDMEEYFHYDNTANGGMHVIVPSKLIAFKSPKDHPTGDETSLWYDVGKTRHFTPIYYAEILGDFQVNLVVACTEENYDYQGLQKGGIEVEKLPITDASPMNLLRCTDRFLTLAQLVPGAIAVHGDDAGLGTAELLLNAYLIKHYGFDAKSAMAWLRLMHPGEQASSLKYSVHDCKNPNAVNRHSAVVHLSTDGISLDSAKPPLPVKRSATMPELLSQPDRLCVDSEAQDSLGGAGHDAASAAPKATLRRSNSTLVRMLLAIVGAEEA